jgi:hypothetical protein
MGRSLIVRTECTSAALVIDAVRDRVRWGRQLSLCALTRDPLFEHSLGPRPFV